MSQDAKCFIRVNYSLGWKRGSEKENVQTINERKKRFLEINCANAQLPVHEKRKSIRGHVQITLKITDIRFGTDELKSCTLCIKSDIEADTGNKFSCHKSFLKEPPKALTESSRGRNQVVLIYSARKLSPGDFISVQDAVFEMDKVIYFCWFLSSTTLIYRSKLHRSGVRMTSLALREKRGGGGVVVKNRMANQ